MKIPSATYRIQFNRDFTFRDASEIPGYLSSLGIAALYASPVFRCVTGSTHGYDITDPNALNPELGTPEDFRDLSGDVKAAGMEWLQDIVPNHVAFSGENPMVADVAENGRDSKYSSHLDIYWDHPYLTDRVLAPFLGSPFGETLERGEIVLNYGNEGFFISYYQHRFPLAIETYYTILGYRLKELADSIGKEHPDFIKYLGILYVIRSISGTDDTTERYEQIRFVKRMLSELYSSNRRIGDFIDENISIYNGEPGNAESYNLLDELMAVQNFRLAFWKVATQEINYRRFFNINELISLRTEDESVMRGTHELILSLLRSGDFSALRIDHIDGLYDPLKYIEELRSYAGDIFIVAEKILESDETLPANWQIQGTTGYDFLNMLNGVFCNTKNRDKFSRIYRSFTGSDISYDNLLYSKKKMIIEKHLTGDVDNITHLLKRISVRDRHGSDITFSSLRRTITEISALFPVYRTYINSSEISENDRMYIIKALRNTRKKNPDLINEIRYLEKFLLFEFYEYVSDEEKNKWINFVMRFQQLTGPLMAKGFEDTTLYIYNRLLSLNEVGGDPNTFGTDTDDFHSFNRHRCGTTPHTMNTTSTHDTKRGEDIRARINVLSEMPSVWKKKLASWSRFNRSIRRKHSGSYVPDRNSEYFIYQTLVGSLPFDGGDNPDYLQRLKSYIIKAERESKVHTAWLDPDEEYESAILSFVEEILDAGDDKGFFADFRDFAAQIAYYGIFNSLSQALLKITSPGLPDFYQGSELWELSFVDPDNRRPVDFEIRRKILGHIMSMEKAGRTDELLSELISNAEDGSIKLYLIYKALNFRKQYKDVFDHGEYIPLVTRGKLRNNLISFARRYSDALVLTVVPRFLSSVISTEDLPLGDAAWGGTSVRLPVNAPASWRNVLTGETVNWRRSADVAEALNKYPVALLIGES